MDGYDISWGLADDTATDVLPNCVLAHGHHRNRGVGREPVGLVVATSIVAHTVEVAEQEGHCAEPSETGSGIAKVLVVRLFVALNVEQGVAVPELSHSVEAGGHCG